jgi:uncharacterized protein (TIGR03437 family)
MKPMFSSKPIFPPRVLPSKLAAAVFAAACALTSSAQTITGPGLIAIGSPMTFGGTNAPDTYSSSTTFSSTPVLADNGAVKIWQTQTATSATGEWDIFYLQTTNGGPLAGNLSAYWDIEMNYTLTAPVYLDGVVNQWLVNGTPVAGPLGGIGSICCAAASNPILPGASYYNNGGMTPIPAGLYSNSDSGDLWREIYVQPYSLISGGGINPSTANEFIFALHFTAQAPMPNVTAAVSASQFGEFPNFAPGSWIEIYGTNLAATTQTWGSANFNGVEAPTTLSGTTVTIGGQSAFVDYVSPTQVNVQVPGGVGLGSQPLIVNTAAGASPPFTVNVVATRPGLLAPTSFNIGGTQYTVAEFSNGTFVLPPGAISGITSQRAQAGDTILLYGIGFGSVTGSITASLPPGQIVEQSNTLAEPFTISIGGVPATFTYDGLAPAFIGLYQFNVVVPQVAASDKVPVTFTLGGAAGTQTLYLAVGN